jgi:hypothetical protein
MRPANDKEAEVQQWTTDWFEAAVELGIDTADIPRERIESGIRNQQAVAEELGQTMDEHFPDWLQHQISRTLSELEGSAPSD